ncbi:transcriptional regulator, effector binding domain protein [Leptotrichia trevisanii]|uniref:Transcriptional regulator, effector binding domain protein n=1 Tax=Leptotrichia trevisanii TaxID=109328 RepID=A0A510KQE4_9FUSO|nr:GyrI-like domain-containing protein [Leptotrichia trevisanii]BBM52213.1 transcriptional regulator, effector binding domain protein [Leptotrichia trevisanii]
MKYEIVEIKEKTLAGFKTRVKDDETMSEKISNLWKKLYSEKGAKNIENRINDNAIGVYYNYSNEDGFSYDCLTGCEVKDTVEKIPEDMIKIQIPEGKYAKFIVIGNPEKAVGEFWYKFWKEFGKEQSDMRKYTYDFEEYIAGNDYENTEIHIYISIK